MADAAQTVVADQQQAAAAHERHAAGLEDTVQKQHAYGSELYAEYQHMQT